MTVPTNPVTHAGDGKVSKAERLGLASPIAEVTDSRTEAEQMADKLDAALKHFGYEIHPKANETPSLTVMEYLALRGLIEANGQLQPVLLYKDTLVDGRHRLMACYDLGINPRTRQLPDGADLEAVIYDAEARRHQTKSQMAAFTVLYYEDKVRELTEAAEEARKAKLANAARHDPEDRHESPITFVSQLSGVGYKMAQNAVALLNAGRVDLLLDVRNGVISSMERAYQQHLEEQKGAETKDERYELFVTAMNKVGNAAVQLERLSEEIRGLLAWVDDDGSVEGLLSLLDKAAPIIRARQEEIMDKAKEVDHDD